MMIKYLCETRTKACSHENSVILVIHVGSAHNICRYSNLTAAAAKEAQKISI